MKEKRCKQCGTIKPISEFYSNWRSSDGHFGLCKSCLKENRAKEYQENKHHIIERAKRYYRQNRSHVLAVTKEYQKKNRSRISAIIMQKYRTCPEFRIEHNLRTRLCLALKKNMKSTHTMELIGCSKQDLIKHLEGQFKTGMTWDNYGKWHLDHIRPCCSFDLTDISQQKVCFNWQNLQPLWAQENLRKGSRLIAA